MDPTFIHHFNHTLSHPCSKVFIHTPISFSHALTYPPSNHPMNKPFNHTHPLTYLNNIHVPQPSICASILKSVITIIHPINHPYTASYSFLKFDIHTLIHQYTQNYWHSIHNDFRLKSSSLIYFCTSFHSLIQLN